MNKSELIESVALKANVSTAKAEELVDFFFQSMAKTLSQDGRVEIRGFGALSVKDYEGYQGRNPRTGEKIFVREKRLPVWRTGLELKKRVDAHKPESRNFKKRNKAV
jgi:integration host factor subunit beta